MVYDPLGQQNRLDVGIAPGNFTPTPSPRMASFNGGPTPIAGLLPTPAAEPPRSMVGKFNVGLGFPTPYVPQVGAGPTPTPLTETDRVPSMGLFETMGRGLESVIPGMVLGNDNTTIPGWINGQLNNFVGLVGKTLDWPLSMLKPIKELPGGQDIAQAFSQMPDDPEKRVYQAQLLRDPINREHYMAEYLRAFEKDYATVTGRSRLFSNTDLPSESLGEQLGRVIMGALSFQSYAAVRTYVGSPIRDVVGTVVNRDPKDLPPDLAQMREQYVTGKINWDQFLDDITVSRYAFTQDTGITGSLLHFAGTVLTDPLTWETLGLGEAASLGSKVVGMRAANAMGKLNAADPALHLAIKNAGGSLVDWGNRVREVRPDLFEQAHNELPRAGRITTEIEPVLLGAAKFVNKAINPIGWFGPVADRVAALHTAQAANSSVRGVVNWAGAANVRAVMHLAQRYDNLDTLNRAIGAYTTHMRSVVEQRAETRRVVQSGGVVHDVKPTEVITARLSVKDRSSEAAVEDMARSVAREDVPRGQVGPEALARTLEEARARSAQQLSDLTGAPLSETQREMAHANRKMLSSIHAWNYGRVINEFMAAKQAIVERATKAVEAAKAVSAEQVEKEAGRLSRRERLTLIGDRELTIDRAMALQKLVKSGDKAAARLAVEQYDLIGHNFRGAILADDEFMSRMTLLLKHVLESEDRLIKEVKVEKLQEPMKSWVLAERAKYGDQAYSVGLAPTDVWGVVEDAEGKVIAAHPWVDISSDTGTPWLPNRMDQVRLGLFTKIRGNRMMAEARRSFTLLGIERGLTAGESEALFAALRRSSSERMVGPRALSHENVWFEAQKVGIPDTVRLKLGERGLTWMLVKAWEGDIRTVGWSTKFTGMLKTKFAARGNWVARIAEDLYPKARFYLSPNFNMQETIEGPFYDILRGVKPGVHYNEKDVRALELVDKLCGHERFEDQYEYMMFTRVLSGEVGRIAGQGTKLNSLVGRLRTSNLTSIKRSSYIKQVVHEAGIEFEKGLNDVQPGLYQRLQAEFGTTDREEILLRYFEERGLGRAESNRHGVTVMERNKQPNYGAKVYLLNGDNARFHGYPNYAALREDVRAGRYSESQFMDTELRGGADPEYAKLAYAQAMRPSAKDWQKQIILDYLNSGATRREAEIAAKAFMGPMRVHAKALGIGLDDYLANRFSQGPTYLSHSRMIPSGAKLQSVRQHAERLGIEYHLPGTQPYHNVINRGRSLLPRPAGFKTRAATRPQELVRRLSEGRLSPDERATILTELGAPRRWIENDAHIITNGYGVPLAYNGPFQPGDMIDAVRMTMGAPDIEKHAATYRELPSMMLAVADMLDDTTVEAFNKLLEQRLGPKFTPEGALILDTSRPFAGDFGTVLDNPREELASRMMLGWASSQLVTGPMQAFDSVMRMLDELTHGDRKAWIRPDGKPGYSMGLARNQLESLLKEFGGLQDKGLGPKLYDFIDSYLGRPRRTLTFAQDNLQPAAIDRHIAHVFGFYDKSFVDAYARHLGGFTGQRDLASLTSRPAKYHANALEALGLTEEEYAKLPREFQPNAKQYEWMLSQVNEIAHQASAEKWMGHDWMARDIQSVLWAYSQKLYGVDPALASDLLEHNMWNVGVSTFPGAGALHDRATHGLFSELRQVWKDTKQTWAGRRAVPTSHVAMENVHHDMMQWAQPIIERETGGIVLGSKFAAGTRMKSGTLPMTAYAFRGTDAQLDTAMNLSGHMLQQDEVIATSEHFYDNHGRKVEGPDRSDPKKGHYWAIDFTPSDQSPMSLNALVRFLSNSYGPDLDHYTLAMREDGRWTVRGIWLDNGGDSKRRPLFNLDHDKGISDPGLMDRVRLSENTDFKLNEGYWGVDAGLLSSRTNPIPVEIKEHVVRVKRVGNHETRPEFHDAEAAHYAQMNGSAQPSWDIAHTISTLDRRMFAMRNGGIDHDGLGESMHEAKNQIESMAPGTDFRHDNGWDGYRRPYYQLREWNDEAQSDLRMDGHYSPGREGWPDEGPPFEVIIRKYRGSSTNGIMGMRDEEGKGFIWCASVDFEKSTGRVNHIFSTGIMPTAKSQGWGFRVYDRIADQFPELQWERAVGAGGSFSSSGGVYAYMWLKHHRHELAKRLDSFSTVEWQNAQAEQQAARLELTRYESAQVDRGRVPERSWVAGAGRTDEFRAGLTRTHDEHPYGLAVTVHEPEFYSDPGTRLFLSDDGLAGVAVGPDGDLVSVFKHPTASQDINPLIAEAALLSRTLDGFDINGKLPGLYGQHGFRPAARLKFNPKYQPDGWAERQAELDSPDVVFMVHDPLGVSGLPEVPTRDLGGWDAVKGDVPVFDMEDYDGAKAAQEAAAAIVDREAPIQRERNANDARAEQIGKPYLDNLRATGRADLAERLVRRYAGEGFNALDDAISRNAPSVWANNRGLAQARDAYSRGDAARNPRPDQRPGGGAIAYQRGPRGVIRGATALNARHESAVYFLKHPDPTTAIHESFHVFADELDESARLNLRQAYQAAHRLTPTGRVRRKNPLPDWNGDVEEWAAQQFEEYARSGHVANSTMAANFNAYAKWTRTDLGLVHEPMMSPKTTEVFDVLFARGAEPAAHFNLDEERVYQAARLALLREEDQAMTTHFYARGRNWVERSLNHPYFGLYPLSYMWGKVVPELFRFLVKKPFGLNAPLGGLALAKDVWLSIQLQVQTDPELKQWLSDHPQLIQFFNILVPGTPWETPVNLPVVYRRAIQNYIDSYAKVQAGGKALPYDWSGALDDMITYMMGIGHFAGQMQEIGSELMPSPKVKAGAFISPPPATNPFAAVPQG